MKILLIHDYGFSVGGGEGLTFALREELRKRGHDARLFASSAGLPGIVSGADYQCLGTLSRFRTLLQTLNPWAYWRLRTVLREFKPDVVHVRMFLTQLSPLILPLLKQFPSLYHVVWYRPVCPTGTKLLPTGLPCRESAGWTCYQAGCIPLKDWGLLRFQLWLWRKWRHVFRRIVANSRAVQASLLAEGIEPVEVIQNGVAVESVVRAMSSQPLVAFAGRLVPEKGVDLLLEAFARVVGEHSGARLLIAGDGPERAKLALMAEQLGIASRVTFFGHLAKQEMESRFVQAWVQVVPSRWAEPFGLVAVEAMMRGTAVVASTGGGLVDIIQDGVTGFLVPANDPRALAESLSKLLRDRTRAEVMGKAGRERAKTNFNLARQCEQILSLYQQMLSETPDTLCAETGMAMETIGRKGT